MTSLVKFIDTYKNLFEKNNDLENILLHFNGWHYDRNNEVVQNTPLKLSFDNFKTFLINSKINIEYDFISLCIIAEHKDNFTIIENNQFQFIVNKTGIIFIKCFAIEKKTRKLIKIDNKYISSPTYCFCVRRPEGDGTRFPSVAPNIYYVINLQLIHKYIKPIYVKFMHDDKMHTLIPGLIDYKKLYNKDDYDLLVIDASNSRVIATINKDDERAKIQSIIYCYSTEKI